MQRGDKVILTLLLVAVAAAIAFLVACTPTELHPGPPSVAPAAPYVTGTVPGLAGQVHDAVNGSPHRATGSPPGVEMHATRRDSAGP